MMLLEKAIFAYRTELPTEIHTALTFLSFL